MTSNDFANPGRDNGLIYLGRMARQDPSLRPLVLEALIHLPVVLLVHKLFRLAP